MTTSSMKVPGNPEEYHYLGHGYNARTGKFIKVQLFNHKPSLERGSKGMNEHPYTTISYEDSTSKKSIASSMKISGQVEVSLANLPLKVKGILKVLRDSKEFYDSS